MRWPPKVAARHAVSVGVSLLVLAAGGCGTSEVHRSTSPPERADISIHSPGLLDGATIPARYACTKGIWLPLRWGAVPPDTGELVLYMGSFGERRPTSKNTTYALIVARSMVVGLKPTTHELPAGALPYGAHTLVDAQMPTCPSNPSGREFVFRLYALPRSRRFEHNRLISEAMSNLVERISHEASAIGVLSANYAPA